VSDGSATPRNRRGRCDLCGLGRDSKGEGTSGAAERVDFREEACEAALTVANGFGRGSPGDSSLNGNRYRTVAADQLLRLVGGGGWRREVSEANRSG